MRINALLCLTLPLALAGCMGPIALHKAVLSYDETISQLEREMLLLNIARTHQDTPGHFTVTSSIAATFNYQANAGFGATIFERAPAINVYGFNIGTSVAENPTLSIVPIQGEEFTKRILTPMDESVFLFLVFQGTPIDMLMRLMARGIELQAEDGRFQRFILNWPIRLDEYREFRQRALHLVWLGANRRLFVNRISYKESIRAKLPGPLSAGDLASSLEKGYRWRKVGDDGTYELTRPTTGRVAITNYDLGTLTNSELQDLNDRASANPNNFVFLDIRPGYPGGDFPISGGIKLRSLNEILEFLAATIDDTPEVDVDPDPRTGKVEPNPRSALTILVDEPTRPGVLRMSYGGHDYAIGDTPWDRDAFKLLYQLFQMTVTDVSGIGLPITISK